jgi:glycosyl transferase family 2
MAHRNIDIAGKSWRSRVKRFFARKQAPMRIDLYASCWNEERIIPFFLRHYEPIVDRIIIFDDGSTDRSRELLAASPKVELRRLKKGESYILMQMREMSQCWKESRGRADWAIVCDIDEHIYHHHDLRAYLKWCRAEGVTILKPVGIDMVSADFPASDALLSETVRLGVRLPLLDKKAVFDPSKIDEINYGAGRHAATPVGHLIFPPKPEIKLLHYKALGFNYLLDRTQQLGKRKTSFDLERGWGLHDQRPADDIRLGFDQMLKEAMDISLIGKKPLSASPAEAAQRRV